MPAFETLVVDLAVTSSRSTTSTRNGGVLSRENIAFHDSAPPQPTLHRHRAVREVRHRAADRTVAGTSRQ
jgi:hypothetical protein